MTTFCVFSTSIYDSPVKFLNPRTVYVGILKYVPILEFHFNLRSLLIEYDVEILGDKLSTILDPVLKLSSSALTPIDTSSLESIKLFETLPKNHIYKN